MGNNAQQDLVNVDAHTKFDQIMSIRYKRIQISDVIQGP